MFRTGDKARMEKRRPEQQAVSLPTGLRFLVADDEEYNRRLITTILDKWKASYDVATNGIDAVNLLSVKEYDMVLMDLRMPGIDGVNVTKFIRETLKLSKDQLPVLGITADTSDKLGTGIRELFNTFLVKPFSERQISETVGIMWGKVPQASEANGSTHEANGSNDEAISPGLQGDLSNLVRMSGNDMGFVEEMIRQFEKSTSEGLEEMEEAVEEGRFGTVRDLAHKLKPPSRHLGISLLYEMLDEIERKAPRGNRIILRELIFKAKRGSTEAGKNLHDQFRQLQ